MIKRIAIIEDEASLCQSLQIGFSDLGYDVKTADDLQSGYKLVQRFHPHVLLLDVRLPDGNGIEELPRLKKEYPELEIVVMTAYGNTKSVVQAIKNGASDYVNKPFEWEEVELLVRKTFETIELQLEVERYQRETDNRNNEVFIGQSEPMKALIEKVKLAAPTDATILIKGETGTGKERIARMIHQESARSGKPFMALNCGAIPPHLVESELFGHEKGAFTGAHQRKRGIVEWADGGTLFLDEIGELSHDVQAKLLRFLEERSIKRVGGHQEIDVHIRVIAATNRSLERMVEKGQFRSDLYYRLNVVPITVPPLRERGEDILGLSEYYLELFSKQLGKKLPPLDERSEEALLCYSWPGNVRELRNMMERYVILYETGIELSSMLKNVAKHEGVSFTRERGYETQFRAGFSLEQEVEKMEKHYILKALEETKWNISKSAELLGLSRYALQRRIEKYELE